MTRIKICGVTDVETAELCCELGVNFLGLVFAPGRRRVSPDIARGITAYLSKIPRHPVVVGVFPPAPNYEVNLLAEYCGIDWVQLPGDVTKEYAKALKRPVIRLNHISKETSPEDIQAFVSGSFGTRSVCLLDNAPSGKSSSLASPFDWHLLPELSPFIPVLVGGGLTAENVGQLVGNYHPWGVNVSAEVERSGKKSQSKIKAFIKAVQDADFKLTVSSPT